MLSYMSTVLVLVIDVVVIAAILVAILIINSFCS